MKQEHIDKLLNQQKTVDGVLKLSEEAQDTLQESFDEYSDECEHLIMEEGPSDIKECGHAFYTDSNWCSDCSADSCPLINSDLN